jgi:Predicted dehydrogenases and related proteins
MSENKFSRRYFFQGALLAGAVPRGGFGSTPSLKALGYKSPNEKLNLAAIGAGGQPGADLRQAHAGSENVVALADVDWARGQDSFKRFPNAAKFKDFRQMLDKQGKDIDAVIVGPPDHMHAACAWLACSLGSTSTSKNR